MTTDTGAVARIVEGQREIHLALLHQRDIATGEAAAATIGLAIAMVEMCLAIAERER